jgi:hypothetical protein
MTVLDAETKRQAIQERLGAAKTAAERNRLGQFATPPQLALDIVRYVLQLWQDRDDAVSSSSNGRGRFEWASPPNSCARSCPVRGTCLMR